MKILISQKTPTNAAPYEPIQKKYGAEIVFKPFFLIEPLSDREFRALHIDLAEYSAVVFSSRHAIDAFFKLADLMRFKVPETMKYFCTTELVAMYLQKHIVYRKRKIFYGDGKPESVVALIGPKHKGENFLITTTEGSNTSAITSLFEKAGLNYSLGTVCKPVSQDLKDEDIDSYGMLVLYNPADIKSLQMNFPDFKQGDIKMMGYGKGIVNAMQEAGFRVDVQGPTPEAPSAAKTIELYLASLK